MNERVQQLPAPLKVGALIVVALVAMIGYTLVTKPTATNETAVPLPSASTTRTGETGGVSLPVDNETLTAVLTTAVDVAAIAANPKLSGIQKNTKLEQYATEQLIDPELKANPKKSVPPKPQVDQIAKISETNVQVKLSAGKTRIIVDMVSIGNAWAAENVTVIE